MAEIARLVEVVFDDAASSSDLSYKLRSDASLKLGFEKVYSILKLGVEPAGNGKLGFECWEKAQVQAVSSVAYAIACATRSISGLSVFFLPVCTLLQARTRNFLTI